VTIEDSQSGKNQELDFERIRILFDNVKFGYLGVVSSVTLLYFVVANYSSIEFAKIWLLVVSITNIPRIIVSILFAKRMKTRTITRHNIRPWERYMTLSATVAYLGFVSVMFLPYGANATVAASICAFAFMIMATGGVLVLSTSLPQIMIFMGLVMLAIVCRFLLLGDSLLVVVAFIFFLGYIQLIRLIIRQHQILIENIGLKIEHKLVALIDPLTKLGNRRRLYLYLEKFLPASERSGHPFCLILLDIDHFKKYNDSMGHNAGDEMLINVANVMLECSRNQDLVIRYGGEEFLIVLPLTNIEDAEVLAERIRIAVKLKTDVTISAGIVEYHDHINFEQLLEMADKALYSAKKKGRDRHVVSTSSC